jgi:hypothetical protein
VKYIDDGSTGSNISSDFSDWNTFSTAASFIPTVGGTFGGGYFVGQIRGSGETNGGGSNLDQSGNVYNLIMAPYKDGSLRGVSIADSGQGSATPTNGTGTLAFWTGSPTGPLDSAFAPRGWGGTATVYMQNTGGYPIYSSFIGTSTGPNAGSFNIDTGASTPGTGIGGYNDWYVPARDELEIIYRNFKSEATNNDTKNNIGVDDSSEGNGNNSFSTNTQSSGSYSTSNPGQTTAGSQFQKGGSEAYPQCNLWSCTRGYTTGGSATQSSVYIQEQQNGEQRKAYVNSTKFACRAVRRVLA